MTGNLLRDLLRNKGWGVMCGRRLHITPSVPYYFANPYTVQSVIEEIGMVIEWLSVAVQADLREQFVQKDEEIWTPVLARYPGFLGKEVWISPDDLSNVVLAIRWNSFEDWQAVPKDILEETEAQFREALGAETYRIKDSKRFQVRKYS
jgi:uncharacterized protein (TIGR03792 family)